MTKPSTSKPAPSVAASATSEPAARRITPHLTRLQQQVLEFVRGRGDQGATHEEMAEALGLHPDTAFAARAELRDGGLVVDSGRTRATVAGWRATVWTVSFSWPPSPQPAIPPASPEASESGNAATAARPYTSGGAAAIAAGPSDVYPRSLPPRGVTPRPLPTVCPRCKRAEFRDVPIHKDRSIRHDCAGCGLTIRFSLWYGRAGAATARSGREARSPQGAP